MNLKQWMTRHGVTGLELAKALGIASQTVYRYAHGQRVPGKSMMLRICEATDGEVEPNDFYGVPSRSPAAVQTKRRLAS